MPKLTKNDDTKRAERIIELIKRLTIPRTFCTIRDLADDLQIDRRTIHRDIEFLEGIGFEIERSNERKNHLRPFRFFSDSPLAAPIGFTYEELLALYLSKTLFSSLKGTHISASADKAFSRIEKFFPEEKITLLQDAVKVISGPTRNYSEHRDTIKLLLDAIIDCSCIKISYDSRSSKKFDTYIVHPYRLVFYSNGLYLNAHSEKHGEKRTFAVERISHPIKLANKFNRPEHIDDSKITPFGIHGGKSRNAVIWVRSEDKKRMKAKLLNETQKFRFDKDGSMAISLEVSGKEDFFRWLLSQSDSVRLLEPKEWVTEFKDILKRMSLNY